MTRDPQDHVHATRSDGHCSKGLQFHDLAGYRTLEKRLALLGMEGSEKKLQGKDDNFSNCIRAQTVGLNFGFRLIHAITSILYLLPQ